MTPPGTRFCRLSANQCGCRRPGSSNLSEGLAVKDLQTVHRVILALRQKLESSEPEERA
jgi:hypothetical protein